MSDRPVFLNVNLQNGNLQTLNYEHEITRVKDVKLEGEKEKGMLVLTDIRLVWFKTQKKKGFGGLLKKAAVIGGAIAAGAILEGIGDSVGGIGGRALRHAGRGIIYGGVTAGVASIVRDQMYNMGPDGKPESVSIPLGAINDVSKSGNKLIVTLSNMETISFEFGNKKFIDQFLFNIKSAQDEGKCPYCGYSIPPGSTTCPQCGAPAPPSVANKAPRGGAPTGGAPAMGGGGGAAIDLSSAASTIFNMQNIPQIKCPHCGKATPVGEHCVHCGGALVVVCPHCDAHIPVTMAGKYCPSCGKPLR